MVRSALAPPGSLICVGRLGGVVVPGVVVYAVDDPPSDLHPHGWVHHESVVVVQRGATLRTTIGTTLRIIEQDIICRS